MLKGESQRISTIVHAEDLEIYSALKSVDNYKPVNPAYTKEAMDKIHDRVLAARDALAGATADVQTARSAYVAAQWELHNGILGAKNQIVAQFGPNSNEARALKLKKKSERRRSTRAKPSTPPEPPTPPTT